MGWRPPGLSVPLPPLSSPAPQNPEDFHDGVHYVNRWENPARTQHNPMLRQRVVFTMTLPELINCGKAGLLGSVPGILTH